MSSDGEYEDDMDALIASDQQAAVVPSSLQLDATLSPHDALPSLEHVDDNDEGGGGFIVEEEQTSAPSQPTERLSGNKRHHSELGPAEGERTAASESDDIDDMTADDIDRLIAQHEHSTNPTPPPPPRPQPQSQQPSPPTTATNPSAILGCSECHTLAYNVPYYKAFNLLVCNGCQSLHPDKYKLVTKSTAKAQYLMADSDMATLPHLLRPNPTKGSFANMKLYRTIDVLQLVNNRYGSEAAMQAEKQRREVEKLEKEVNKRRKGRAAIEKEKRVREWRMEKEVEGKGHKHTFVDVVVAGKGKAGKGGGGSGSGGKKQKCSSCGFTLDFEEL